MRYYGRMAADETALPRIEEELEQSRQSAGLLLDSLAQKLGIDRAAHNARNRIERAASYVHSHSMRDLATGIGRFVRQRPGPSLCIAVAAGYLVGRALRPR